MHFQSYSEISELGNLREAQSKHGKHLPSGSKIAEMSHTCSHILCQTATLGSTLLVLLKKHLTSE